MDMNGVRRNRNNPPKKQRATIVTLYNAIGLYLSMSEHPDFAFIL